MKRVLAISGLITASIVLVAFAALYFFPHVLWIHYARYQFPRSKNPILYAKPKKRTPSVTLDKSIVENQTFECGDLVFKTTWPKAQKLKKNINRFGWTDIQFPGSKRLIISGLFKGKGKTFAEEVLDGIHSESVKTVVFGKPRTRSDYSIYKQMLEFSLADTPRNKADLVRVTTLSVLKAIAYPVASPSNESFSFKTDAIMGWQIGKPGKKRSTLLIIFDKHNHNYDLVCENMNQREIDTIIRTMRAK